MTTPAKQSTAPLKSTTAKSKSDSPSKLDKEATVPQSIVTPTTQQRGGFRKFLMRISEKIGATEKTEYTKRFTDMCKEVDEYRVIIEDVALQMISILQQDPRYVPRPPGKMEIEAPSGADPFEILEPAVRVTMEHMESKKELEQVLSSAVKLASLHRDYQRNSRRAMHGIRTFINVDYENIRDARNILENFRQELDYAKHELKGSKTPETIQVNNALYANALKNFQKQLHDTEDMLEKLPEAREKHRMEIVKFFQVMKKYHQDCTKATIL